MCRGGALHRRPACDPQPPLGIERGVRGEADARQRQRGLRDDQLEGGRVEGEDDDLVATLNQGDDEQPGMKEGEGG